MSEPTQEQIKEFWKWCGFTYVGDNSCLYPQPRYNNVYQPSPPIDLNNLFKYAVPKGTTENTVRITTGRKGTYCYIIPYNEEFSIAKASDKDPTLALFWALWQVKEKSNE